MKKISLVLLTLAMMLGMFSMAWAQTNVFTANDGGFETGTDFAGNGWTAVNTTGNQYYVGTAPTQYAGSRCAFTSNASSTWTAGTGAAYRHIYRDVTFPAGATNISLSFYYKLLALDGTYDGFRIYMAATTYTPVTTGYPTGTQIGLTWYDDYTTWTQETISLAAATYAGTTRRLVITWRNDGVTPYGVGALDNITLTYTPATGVLDPTAFTATAVSSEQINLSWTRNATPDNVMVARNTTNTFGTPSGTYNVDDPITGGGVVIYNGSGTSYNNVHLDASTQYFYKAWSVNGGTPTYSPGVSANATTMMAPVSSFPFTETFEADSGSRAGWTQIYESGTAAWTYALGSASVITTAYDGVLNARFVGVSGSGTPVTKLVSPLMDLSTGPDYVISFWYGQPNWSGDQNTTKVYYRTSPASSWVELANYTADASVWTQEPGLVLPNPSATYQIAFEGINNYGYPNVVDHVVVDEAATDPVFAVSPSSRDFGDQQIGENSAAQVFTIKNNGGGLLTINSVAKAGTNASEFDLTDLNTYNVELEAGEEITVSVVFSPDTVGAKVARLIITHDQSPTPVEVALNGSGLDTTISELPYIQRWDVTSLVEGWVVYNVNADAYTWGLAVDGTDNSAYIRYNTAMAMNDWLISPRIQMEGGTQYQVTYDYRCASETYPESIKFAFGNAQNPTAMTTTIADHVNFINTTYLSGSGTFTPETSGYYYLGVHGYSDLDMYNIYVDDIRILIPNSQIAEVTSTGTTATVAVPEIEINGVPTATQVDFDGIATGQVCTVWAEFEPEDVTLPNTGLVLTIEGGDLSGIPLTLTHNIGFVPDQVNYKIGEGSYLAVENPGGWTETTITLTPPATKSASRLKIVFPKDRDDETPVELSSFTATLTVDNYVNLAWTTQSETGVQGYYIYRGSSDILEDALLVSPLIDATNTSEQQTYTFQDTELLENGTYYYWLSNADYNGIVGFHGPISVVYSPEGGTTPPIPVVTALGNVYPNPFNPVAYIPFSLAESSAVKIDIFNARGQLIRSINVGERVPGNYKIDWNGKDSSGDNCGTGIYYFRMTTNHDTFTRKAVLMK